MTPRLLVFDDDAAIGRLVTRVAALVGITATAVTDVETFRQNLQQQQPHIVILDLQLGAADGVEQLRYLADREFAGSLILMSGFDTRVLATTHTLARSLGLNVATTLAKPIRIEELETVLTRLHSAAKEQPSNDRFLEAIRNDELSLEFQPIVSRKPDTLKKLEALVRWDHPTKGRIAPSDFLPAAESDTALMDALTDWVVDAALEAYQVLAKLGMIVPIAVNISSRSLHDSTLPDRLFSKLRLAGIPAEHLCVEVTESAAFRDVPRTMEVLNRIRLKGMQLALDDFGTGYSSLKILRQMPFSEIKIDASFVSDVATSRDSRAIVKSIVDLAANMEMVSVAEGVETEEVAAVIETMNVGALQGYLIAPPMPIEAIPIWFAMWKCGDQAQPRPPRCRSQDERG
jgi:EAL domain-containing protein (putative c-di-GMP-specific phosphodiesterase class I)